jgi:predicted peptidase
MNRLLLLTAVLATGLTASAQTTNLILPSSSFQWNVQHAGTMNYLQYLPKDYDGQQDKHWPLMLFLHGAGERGSDVQLVARHGPFKLVREGREFPFIIIAPQCPAGQHWQVEPLMQLVAEAEKKFRVDPSRIYAVGLSMGGFGTWALGVNHPETFAAIIPICGGGSVQDIVMSSIDQPDDLKALSVWAFHGAKDPVVPVAASQETVALLQDKGVRDIKLTIYPDALHDSWTRTFENPEIYDWLLQHHHQPDSRAKQ